MFFMFDMDISGDLNDGLNIEAMAGMKIHRNLVVVAFPLSLTIGCLAEDEQGEFSDDLALELAEQEFDEDLEDAPPRVIEVLDGFDVQVPEEGMSVTMEILYEDGNSELVSVHNEGGELRFEHHNDFGIEASAGEAACSAKCSDGAYNLLGYSWSSQFKWSYRDANRPSSVTKADAIAAFKHGFGGIQSSRNACSLSDSVSATHAYQGTTSKAPGVSSTGCTSNDGNNVVGWGSLSSGVLGLTCTWYSGGQAVESDQRYSNSMSWYAANAVPSGCSSAFSLRAVATHEAGHTFGLGHTGCYQTMAPSVAPCTSANRKFGRGDVLGLRAIY
ncbi:matrixin family metalloprotease [Pseudenhygromyxa sp. WMMC2535]|uniref:matrixin family metalloprotease n=1 Tax=Pseudenhygromyxa sp. WMMC2535 TaxID=2712867 RepID=UPI001556E92B|nr:matrixin family metalloprotease [Pseudenhygromyxa sp. WMMC2535]NVB40111.1 matrixin family metalloprotease [Pseudenhygromyxa sp. WMMC2535]